MPPELEPLIDRMLEGDRTALARLFSLIERDPGQIPPLMRAIHPNTGSAYVVGVTGPPGAGKSTLADGLVRLLRDGGSSVGVIAVDPSSPIRGGAVLGDRIRLGRHALDQGVFVRSMATRGAHGGLSRVSTAGVRLLDSFGEDFVVLESVGVGQTELDVMHVADTVVVTLVPEAGDAVQVMKAGLMEIGDIFVVNKADREGAGRLASAVKVEVHAREFGGWWTPPVLLTQGHRGKGVDELHAAILDHRRAAQESGEQESNRSQRWKAEFTKALRESIEARLAEVDDTGHRFGSLADRVERGEIDPYSAAAEAMQHLDLRPL